MSSVSLAEGVKRDLSDRKILNKAQRCKLADHCLKGPPPFTAKVPKGLFWDFVSQMESHPEGIEGFCAQYAKNIGPAVRRGENSTRTLRITRKKIVAKNNKPIPIRLQISFIPNYIFPGGYAFNETFITGVSCSCISAGIYA